MERPEKSYSKRFRPFEQRPEQYDAWFDSEKGTRIFPVEVECLKNLMSEVAKPRLEIGVGTGRFASALNIGYGVDPSRKVLDYAKARRINVKHGFAENLPYQDQSFGAVFMIVTVCFLTEPVIAICTDNFTDYCNLQY